MWNGYKTDFGCFFGSPIFADNLFFDLAPKALESLTSIKQAKQFEKNSVIFSIGAVPSGICVLLEGEARLISNANANAVRQVAPNEILGLTEAFSNLPYELRAETITTCRLEFIERGDFISFLHQEPQICFRLAHSLGSNLQKSYRNFSSSTF